MLQSALDGGGAPPQADSDRRVAEAWGDMCAAPLEALQARGAAASIRTLAVIANNVAEKGAGDAGAKYRTLKLANAKVAAAIGAEPAAMALLAGLGFVEAGGTLVIGADFDAPLLRFAAERLRAAAAAFAAPAPVPAMRAAQAAPAAPAAARTGGAGRAAAGKLSLKQRARLEAAARAKRERAQSARERAELLRRLAIDKRARKTEGWSASSGGGVDKGGGGNDVRGFRERFGEDRGGG